MNRMRYMMNNFDEHTYDEILISRVLTCEADLEDEKKFQEKWNNSETFRNLYFELKEIWETSNVLHEIDKLNTEQAVNNFITRINKAEESRKQFIKKIRLIVSSSAAAIFIVFVLWAVLIRNKPIEIITSNNTIKNYILPDNSIVNINKGSKLVYKKHYRGKNREVYLKGEAYFRIKENKSCPFFVNTDIACVKVTGTSFNVSYTEQNVVVSVDTGSVIFSLKNEPAKQIILNAGEAANLSIKAQTISKIKSKDSNYNSWLTGVIKFDQASLSDAVKVLEQYYGTKIIFQDKNIENYQITAIFKNKSLDSVLEILELTFDINITKNDSVILVNSNNKNNN